MESEELIEVEVEIDKDNLLNLALEAHKKNVTLNDYMIELLEDYVRKHKETF